jgi:hypothetical protein
VAYYCDTTYLIEDFVDFDGTIPYLLNMFPRCKRGAAPIKPMGS